MTRDAGGTWSALTGAPLPSMASVEALAVSPSYEDDQTLLVSVGGEGLYRSTDGGASFVAVASDLIEANRVIADFTNPTGIPIQFSPSFADDRTIFAYAGANVLRSTDAGDSWDVLELPTAADFLGSVDPALLDVEPAPSSDDSAGAGFHLSRRVLAALAFLIAVPLVGIGGYLYGRRRGSAPPR